MTTPDLRVGFPDHLDVLFLEGADRGHAKGKVDGVYPEFRNGPHPAQDLFLGVYRGVAGAIDDADELQRLIRWVFVKEAFASPRHTTEAQSRSWVQLEQVIMPILANGITPPRWLLKLRGYRSSPAVVRPPSRPASPAPSWPG